MNHEVLVGARVTYDNLIGVVEKVYPMHSTASIYVGTFDGQRINRIIAIKDLQPAG